MVNLTYMGTEPHEQPDLRLSWEPGQTQPVSAVVALALQTEYPDLYHEETQAEEEQPATPQAPPAEQGESDI